MLLMFKKTMPLPKGNGFHKPDVMSDIAIALQYEFSLPSLPADYSFILSFGVFAIFFNSANFTFWVYRQANILAKFHEKIIYIFPIFIRDFLH